MTKLVSLIASGVVGAVLAAFAAWGVVSSNTAAPDKNPASNQFVDYGQK